MLLLLLILPKDYLLLNVLSKYDNLSSLFLDIYNPQYIKKFKSFFDGLQLTPQIRDGLMGLQ